MIVFIEGVDKVGKTTIINHLKKNTNWIFYKPKCPKEINKDFRQMFLNEMTFIKQLAIENKGKIICCDRGFWTEYVYSTFYKRTNLDTDLINKYLDLWQLFPIFVFKIECKNKLEWKKRFKEEKQVKFKDVIAINKLFKKSFIKMIPDVLYTTDDYKKIIEMVIRYGTINGII